MLEQNNPDVMRQMIEDHRARLMASNHAQIQWVTPRAPGRIRVSSGQMLILLGERLRGVQDASQDASQDATVESRPVRLALAE